MTWNKNAEKFVVTVITKAGLSGALVPWFTCTCEGSVCVDAVGIGVTVMGNSGTFVYI